MMIKVNSIIKSNTMYRTPIVLLIAILTTFTITSQSQSNKWVVGAGITVAKFNDSDSDYIGDKFTFQLPSLNASRHIYKGFIADVALSFNTLNKIPGLFENNISYFSFDGAIRYDFGMADATTVPYLLVGGSLVKTTKIMTPTFNVGGGGTFWISPRYGINTQLVYKYSLENYTSMRSHLFFSLGIVYSLELKTMITRLWNRN